jgi:hypothetical protein
MDASCGGNVPSQFVFGASMAWNLVSVVDFTVELYDPLRNTRSLVKYYHTFAWLWAGATVAYIGIAEVFGWVPVVTAVLSCREVGNVCAPSCLCSSQTQCGWDVLCDEAKCGMGPVPSPRHDRNVFRRSQRGVRVTAPTPRHGSIEAC